MPDRAYNMEMYHYLKDKGYNFILYYDRGVCRNIYASLTHDEKSAPNIFEHSTSLAKSDQDIEQALKMYSSSQFSLESEDPSKVDFFIHTFKKSGADEQKDMLKHINEYFGIFWLDKMEKIFLAISPDNKSLVRNIHHVSISIWTATSIDLNKLDGFLQTQGVGGSDLDNFYFKFFKARKIQIQDPKTGPVVRDFLLNKYSCNEDKLAPYLSFFNYLVVHFQSHEVDLENPVHKGINVIALQLSCKLAVQKICIDGFYMSDIRDEITRVVHGLQKHHGFDFYAIELLDNKDDMIEVRCYGHELFTSQYLKEKITQWLLFKKQNLAVRCNDETVCSWLLQGKLHCELKEAAHQPKHGQRKL